MRKLMAFLGVAVMVAYALGIWQVPEHQRLALSIAGLAIVAALALASRRARRGGSA